jgi:hypothetical protein
MKTYKIELQRIDYSGEDFCGELSSFEASKIISEQPTELTISFELDEETIKEWDERSKAGECDDWLVDGVVSDYCYDNGILQPTTFDYCFID